MLQKKGRLGGTEWEISKTGRYAIENKNKKSFDSPSAPTSFMSYLMIRLIVVFYQKHRKIKILSLVIGYRLSVFTGLCWCEDPVSDEHAGGEEREEQQSVLEEHAALKRLLHGVRYMGPGGNGE